MTKEHARTATAVGCLAILAVAVASASVAVAQIAHAAKSDATVADLVIDRFAYLVIANLAGYLALAGVMWHTGRKRVERIVSPLVDAKLAGFRLQLSRIEGLCRDTSHEVESSKDDRNRVATAVEKIEKRLHSIDRRHMAEDVINGGPPIAEESES